VGGADGTGWLQLIPDGGISGPYTNVRYNNGQVGINWDSSSMAGTLNVRNAGSPSYITLTAFQADTYDKGFLVRSSRGTSGASVAVKPGDVLFNLYAQGSDGTDFSLAGGILMAIDGNGFTNPPPITPGKAPGLILFQTASPTGSYTERVRINSLGNVGIGESFGLSRLSVKGNTSFALSGTVSTVGGSSTITGNGTTFTYQVGVGDRITVTTSSGSETRSIKTIASETSLTVDAPFTGGTGSAAANVSPSVFRTDDSSGNATLVVTDQGNIGVGTISPAAKLEVAGGVRLNTATTKPTCDATSRGTFWFTQGGAGVKDSAEVCAKDATDAYAWRSLY
jgi:hypothetical protein